MTHTPTPNPLAGRSLRAPVLWGVVWGVIQAAAPLGLWWLDPATVYALSLALIAGIYIGFRSRMDAARSSPLGCCEKTTRPAIDDKFVGADSIGMRNTISFSFRDWIPG